ncbi:YkvA family protein [Leptolyngbya sp. AN02str]|uniref:YkvA family protein n=1 Tax=Leptolyngbya sp. AN02str TaxID=3423363 RepID=UPI003D310C81
MKFFARPVYQLFRKLLAHPKYRWWMAAATLVYVISPFDFLPDMLPFLGQIDDALLVSLVLTELSPEVMKYVRSLKQKNSAQTEA